MKAVNEAIKKQHEKPAANHNSEGMEKLIQQSAQDMANIDAERRRLNKDAAAIRETLKEKGVDRDAFRDVYGYYKKRRHEKEGYDESHKLCFEALNKMDTGNLFDFMDDKED